LSAVIPDDLDVGQVIPLAVSTPFMNGGQVCWREGP
jgi:hypothetical protein